MRKSCSGCTKDVENGSLYKAGDGRSDVSRAWYLVVLVHRLGRPQTRDWCGLTWRHGGRLMDLGEAVPSMSFLPFHSLSLSTFPHHQFLKNDSRVLSVGIILFTCAKLPALSLLFVSLSGCFRAVLRRIRRPFALISEIISQACTH